MIWEAKSVPLDSERRVIDWFVWYPCKLRLDGKWSWVWLSWVKSHQVCRYGLFGIEYWWEEVAFTRK